MIALNQRIAPLINLPIDILIEVRDRAGADPRAPQGFRNIFNPVDRNTRQIHLNQRFFDRTFSPAVPLDDVELEIEGTSDSILLNEQFRISYWGIDGIKFDDLSVWTGTDISNWLQTGNDTLNGGTGRDQLYGDAGNDTLTGGTNNDRLNGQAGDDLLEGDADNDTLSGGAGDDTFKFSSGDDEGTIKDFTAGSASDDVIELSGFTGVDDFADVQAITSDVGNDAVIDFGSGDKITLVDVSKSSLHADDFSFV